MGRSLWPLLLCALVLGALLCTSVSGQKTKPSAPADAAPTDTTGAEEVPPGTAADKTTPAAADAGSDLTATPAAADPASDESLPPTKQATRTRKKSPVPAADAEATTPSEETTPATKVTEPADAATASEETTPAKTISEPVAPQQESEADTTAEASDAATTPGGKKDPAVEEVSTPKASTVLPSTRGIDNGQASLADDIQPSGNCSKEITTHCKDRTPGPASYVNCITERVKVERAGNDDSGLVVSENCKVEVRAFKIKMYSDVSMDKKMEKACQKEIRKYCDDDFLYPEPGNIVACLREVNQVVSEVSPACKAEVFRAQQDAARDFRMDPQLNELCSSEAAKFCKDEKPGEGGIQQCLRANRKNLAWDCQAELFRQEVENADDIRLNVRLFQACLSEKRKYCKEVTPGDARVKDCLEDHRNEPDFGPACKTEFDKMIERRATDFRLDPSLRKYCRTDIADICYPDAEDITDVANYDAKVIQCLQDYRDELKDPRCRQQVHKLTKRAAEDIRFDRPLADVCRSDRAEKCKGVPDGNAQVFLCLQSHRDKLHETCRAALFEQEVRFAEDIDFKFPMKQACSGELAKFCENITPGHAAVIKCLQEKLTDPDMGEECKKEVKRDEIRSAADYRLNYRLNRACMNDIQQTCSAACTDAAGSAPCGGKVLKCLTDNLSKIKSAACKAEVFSFERREAEDINLDVPLQTACTADLAKLCKDVSKDHAKTLECLRSHKEELTPECKAEESRFSIMEASDIRLTPTLMNGCGLELKRFCADVPPGGGRMFKCLQQNLEEVGMSTACKGEVNLQEARHSKDYRLDIAVRKACDADASRVCADVDHNMDGHAPVLRCFVSNYDKLGGGCQTEMQYAIRAALFQYTKGNDLSKDCDESVDALCNGAEAKPIQGAVIGAYGQCLLSGTVEPKLTGFCQSLAKVAGKEGGYVGGNLDDSRLADTLAKLEAVKVAIMARGGPSEGLVLTGWVAFAAIGSLVLVIFGGGYALYRKYYGKQNQYTLVVKGGDV